MSNSSNRVTRLAAEALVIIASILAAFGLEASWDERQERQEEERVLEALHTEFLEARERIEYYRGLQSRILHSVASVADSIDAAVSRGAPGVALPDTALGLLYVPPTTSVSLGTMQGLISSARLGIIRDPELRTALALWETVFEELAEEETYLRELALGEMDRELRERMNTYGLWDAGTILTEELSDEQMRASRIVPASTSILGTLHLRRGVLTHALDEFDELVDELDRILALIERAREA